MSLAEAVKYVAAAYAVVLVALVAYLVSAGRRITRCSATCACSTRSSGGARAAGRPDAARAP